MKYSKYNDVYLPQDGVGAGRLAINGKNTLLKIVNKGSFPDSYERITCDNHARNEVQDCHGTLNDGSKASLLNCVSMGFTRYGLGEAVQHEVRIFPHYILIGDSFISSGEEKIKSISYYFENADRLVNTLQTFGTIYPEHEEFKKILEADHERGKQIAEKYDWNTKEKRPAIGDHPILQYFSGHHEIAQCQTRIGSIAMENCVSHGFGASSGVKITNEIMTSLEFSAPKSVDKAFDALGKLHNFFQLCLGKRQRYLWIKVQLVKGEKEADSPTAKTLEGYWSYCNEKISGETSPTYYGDVLLDAGAQREEFETVLSGWMDSTATVGRARNRFANAFYANSYNVDRMVGAANMFDILPSTHVPAKVEMDEITRDAVEETRRRFKALPDSLAQQSVLSVLGRIGKASLRDKVYHRADIVAEADPQRFAELRLPCNQAVLCRNHFVHGSEGTFDYGEEVAVSAFLTDTLEFVFAVSDLIDLGWDYRFWCSKGSSLSHKFGSYIVDYEINLRMLKQLVNK